MLFQINKLWRIIFLFFLSGCTIILLTKYYVNFRENIYANKYYPVRLDAKFIKNINDINISNSTYINNSNNNYNNISNFISVNQLNESALVKLSNLIDCVNDKTITSNYQKGKFWILKNYIKAEWQNYSCYEAITYTTHGDFTFLNNVPTLIERWMAPISMSIYSPGTDFMHTINSILYLRQCLVQSLIIRYFISFHIYFEDIHFPEYILTEQQLLEAVYNCDELPSHLNESIVSYKKINNLTYPINIGRNVARDASITHYVFASDPELYPSPKLVYNFLNMLISHENLILDKKLKVFPVMIFEVVENAIIPNNKTELQRMLKNKSAQIFHEKICKECHKMPKSDDWIEADEITAMEVFTIGKRLGKFKQWEPIYIGTKYDPYYDERLSWEGQKDKMLQGYILCVNDYDFNILNNAFLVHRPGIKTLKNAIRYPEHIANTAKLISKQLHAEIIKLYGKRDGCRV